MDPERCRLSEDFLQAACSIVTAKKKGVREYGNIYIFCGPQMLEQVPPHILLPSQPRVRFEVGCLHAKSS
jgi:hypothetical protein